MNRLAVAAVVALSFTALAASHPNDEPGKKDHPVVPRFPGFYISSLEQNDYNEVEITTAWSKSDGVAARTENAAGKYWNFRYVKGDEARSPSAIEFLRNYENAVKKAGGRTLYLHKDHDTGGHASFRMPVGKVEAWVYVNYFGDAYDMVVVEPSQMEQKVEVTAAEMLEALNKNGFIALNGIHFDTGKDTIKPESEALLAEIVTLLNQNKALKVSVEGHTDNVGNAKSNEALSKKRAESVKKFLVGKGIAAARLSANGFGDTRPIADNRLEDGRAKNRRVELVKK